MFKPETEDMLPRAVPKPTSAPMALNNATVRPTVPELSILFGENPAVKSQQPIQKCSGVTMKPLTETYASWKKKVLPKVSFPPDYALITGPTKSLNGPEATVNGEQTAISHSVSCPPSNVPVLCYDFSNNAPALSQTLQYNRLSEHAVSVGQHLIPNTSSCQLRSLDGLFRPPTTTLQPHVPPLHNPPTSARGGSTDVLTICAGTQTMSDWSPSIGMGEEGINEESFKAILQRLPSREEFQELSNILKIIYEEQCRLSQHVQAFLLQQPKHVVDGGHQWIPRNGNEMSIGKETIPSSDGRRLAIRTYICEENSSEQEAHEENQLNTFNAPTAIPVCIQRNPFPLQPSTSESTPTTQSTDYGAPKQPPVPALPPPPSPPAPPIDCPATDKSAVMNALALKYLPDAKINALMQNMNVTKMQPPMAGNHHYHQNQTPTSSRPPASNTLNDNIPLRDIENVVKGMGELSNASYRYLKKYRLLPENAEQEEDNYYNNQQQQQYHQQPLGKCQEPTPSSPQQLDELLDLDRLRNQPKFL